MYNYMHAYINKVNYFPMYMQCNGKQISWSHLVNLYQLDTKHNSQVTGLRLVPKLKYEHIYLSSFSKMRVDLATQVHNNIHIIRYVSIIV